MEENPWRDLAGHLLKFTNPDAKAAEGPRLSAYQQGMVGDMKASRKVKIPDCSMEELMEFYSAKQPFPWHWGNSLYLEWYRSVSIPEPTSLVLALLAGGVMLASPEFHVR